MNSARRVFRLASVLSLLPLAGIFASPAYAANVACGQTVVVDTVLTGDVGPCSTGITIGADNITFDLGGHHIIGTAAPGEGPGILVRDRTGVRLLNGVVRGFDAGVAIESSTQITVTAMSLRANIGSSFGFYGDGLVLLGSHQNRLTRNVIRGNGPFSGIALFGSDRNTIGGNVVENNKVELSPSTMLNTGIELGFVGLRPRGSLSNVLANNVVRGNGFDGIRLTSAASENSIRSNVVEGNGLHDKPHRKGDGISLAGQLIERNTLEGNSVRRNGANGIFLLGPTTSDGFTIAGAIQNRIVGNVAVENNLRPEGTPDFDLRDDNFQPPCDANTWADNVFQTRNQPCIS